ncbi:MAG: replication protein RepA [Terriglobales bacterium]
MAEAAPEVQYAEHIDKACRLYRDLGFLPERIAAQLIRSGYPPELVRRRFCDLPASAFPEPPAPRTREWQRRDAPGASSRGAAAAAVSTTVPAPIASILTRLPGRTVPALPDSIELHASAQGISFQYVPLIQCSFPHADPGEAATFTRHNGWLDLTLSATRRDMGLPYGVPARLLTIYCASEAIRTRSPEIYLGRSVHEFLRCLDVPITRGERGSLRVYANQILRLIHCAVSIDENVRDAGGRTGLHIRQALFAEEARLWWDEAEAVGQGSSLVLSSVLFQSILERSAPLSTAAIRCLRKSPLDLDVYAWLVHRLFHLSRTNTVTWTQLSGQFGHGYAEARKFRHFFLDSLKRVLAVYPEAHVKPTKVGLILSPSRPHVPRERPTLPR